MTKKLAAALYEMALDLDYADYEDTKTEELALLENELKTIEGSELYAVLVKVAYTLL